MLLRRCSRCGEVKPVAEFALDPYQADGFRCMCKPCDARRAREYYRRNRESVLARQRRRQEVTR